MIVKRSSVYTPNGQNRTLHIYLPDDYETSEERYPVMYFFDGHNLYFDEDATYGKSWGLKDFLDSWRKNMIIVGLECSHEGNARLNEYSPYSFTGFFMGDVHGIGKATMDWIVNDIKPMIDSEYRTLSSRACTAIGGSSMGGLMSIYAAVKYNDTFSKAACVSSAVSPCFADVCRDILDSRLDSDTKVFLSWGTEEAGGTKDNFAEDWETHTARNNLALEALLKQQYVQVKLFCQRYGHHREADWEKQVPEFMEYLWF